MSRRAQFYYRNPCPACEEAEKFLGEHDILVVVRDLKKEPFNRIELGHILRHFDFKHFIDSSGAVYKKVKLDNSIPPREELLDLFVKYPDLLKYPIIVSGRLMTIGSGRQQLIDMFQLSVSDNGSGREKEKYQRKQ